MIDGDDACYSCRQGACDDPPPRERILRTAHWRVVHTADGGLTGWLVVVPIRHVTRIAELTADEAAELGPLLVDTSKALEAELGCLKTYVMLFAQAEGFAHAHFHVVPRMPDLPPELRGPRVFGALSATVTDPAGQETQDRVATALAARLAEVRG